MSSPENLFSDTEAAAVADLPAPPAGSRLRSVGLLIAVGALALVVSWFLLPSATYAHAGARPTELGDLVRADLSEAPRYVSGTGLPRDSALGFRRHGARGEFRLTRLKGRDDLWLLLRTPEWGKRQIEELGGYVPPSHFEGRLSRLEQADLTDRPLRKLIAQEDGDPNRGYLLVEGDTPRLHRLSFVALLLLALVGLGCLSLAARLLTNPAPASRSPRPPA